MKTRSQFRKEYEIHTRKLIADYNSYITECRKADIDPIEGADKLIIRFVEINEKTKLATLEDTKLDQVINELVCNEQFNNSTTIVEAWEQTLYKVNKVPFKSKSPVKKYRSKADKFREFVELIEDLENNKDSYIMGYASSELAKLQRVNPFAFEAYFLLGKPVLEELKYNDGKIKEQVIEQHNKNVEPQLLAYLNKNIAVGGRYLIADMTRVLQYGYNLFQIRNPKTGKVKTADAEAYQQSSWYKLRECKIKINGKDCKGFIIEQKFFSIQNAA